MSLLWASGQNDVGPTSNSNVSHQPCVFRVVAKLKVKTQILTVDLGVEYPDSYTPDGGHYEEGGETVSVWIPQQESEQHGQVADKRQTEQEVPARVLCSPTRYRGNRGGDSTVRRHDEPDHRHAQRTADERLEQADDTLTEIHRIIVMGVE